MLLRCVGSESCDLHTIMSVGLWGVTHLLGHCPYDLFNDRKLY